jgi:hypothetical protein
MELLRRDHFVTTHTPSTHAHKPMKIATVGHQRSIQPHTPGFRRGCSGSVIEVGVSREEGSGGGGRGAVGRRRRRRGWRVGSHGSGQGRGLGGQ